MVDVAIIGGGMSGLSAAIACASEGLSVNLFEASAHFGGAAYYSPMIENVPSVRMSGATLTQLLLAQIKYFAESFTVGTYSSTPVSRIKQVQDFFALYGGSNGGFLGNFRTVIIAIGTSCRPTPIDGALSVHEAPLLRDVIGQRVVIIGAGNAAGQFALHYAPVAKHVTMLTKHPTLSDSMSAYLIEAIHTASDRISVWYGIEEEDTERLLSEIKYDVLLALNGRCVCEMDWGLVLPRTEDGCIRVHKNYEVDGIRGLFAIGDIREGTVGRIAGAFGDGGTMGTHIWNYLNGKK